MTLKIPKNQIIFGFMYLLFIFSEQIADDGTAISELSNLIDSMKIKYIIAIAVVGFLFLKYLSNREDYIEFRYEAQKIIVIIVALSVITVIKQINNGFLGRSYNEIFFWLLPIIYVYFLVNNIHSVKRYIDTAFTIQFVFFFIDISDVLSLSNILKINFIESNSPFESEYSFYGLVFFLFYLYVKDKPRSFLSFIMTFLAFKRMAVLFAIIALMLYFLIPQKAFFYKKPRNSLCYFFTAIFISIPLFFHLICSNEFGIWFYNLTGLNFNAFISGRLDRLNLCIDNEMLYGLGSTTEFLNHTLALDLNRNLHNDILRIYLECGVIGTIFFTVCFFKIASRNIMSFFLILYLFTDMIFNHFLGAGRTAFWIIIYLSIYYYNSRSCLQCNDRD